MLVLRVWKGWKKKLKRRRRPVWQLGGFLGPALLAVLAYGAPAAAAVDIGSAAAGTPEAWIDSPTADIGSAAGVPTAGNEASAPSDGVPSFAMSPVWAVEALAPFDSRDKRPSMVSGESGPPVPAEEAALHGAFFQFPVEALESSSHAGSLYRPA